MTPKPCQFFSAPAVSQVVVFIKLSISGTTCVSFSTVEDQCQQIFTTLRTTVTWYRFQRYGTIIIIKYKLNLDGQEHHYITKLIFLKTKLVDMKHSLTLMLFFSLISLSSCQAIGDIFKAGVWVGILIVAVVVGLIIFLVSRGKK